MARRQRKGIEFIASLPWPLRIVLGILAFLAIRYGLAWYFSSSSSSITQQLGQQLSKGQLAPFAWMALALCWIGAISSYLESRKRRQLLATQTSLESLRALSWREFELLVGEAFRQRGYTVEETGLGGADGGVDLIVRKDGRKELVQCKQWRKAQVNVATVREMWGLTAHHGAHGVKIVCVGDFTTDAETFARGKSIELVTGDRLLELVREGQVPTRTSAAPQTSPASESTSSEAITCPACSSSMVLRRNKTSGKSFWGCSNFPRCRGRSLTRLS